MVNVSMGGSLFQDIAEELSGPVTHNLVPSEGGFENLAHEVVIAAGSRLSDVMGGSITSLQVNSLHHQGVKDLAPTLRASAWAPDGLVEGIEMPDHPFLIGVQWHPESLYQHHQAMHNLFMSFIHAAINHR
jgi:putative glutamine amidotransferase